MKNLVLGYGNVGRLIAEELKGRGEDVVIGRHSDDPVYGYTTVKIDVLDSDSMVHGTYGVDRIFVTTGLEYKLSVWQHDWPIIIDNVIRSAKANRAQIIFIDNIYLYGPAPLQNPITEEHPRQPPSQKGAVRLALVQKLEQAMKDGVSTMIVRCADFYGPNVSSSGVTMAVENVVRHKKAYFMGDPETKHTYSYVPDVARAVVELARAGDTYDQTWHVPSGAPITGNDLKALVAEVTGRKGRWSNLSRGSMSFMGIFVPILKELREMMYQFENDYVLDWSKFARRFPNFDVTTYKDGLTATVEVVKKRH